MKKISRIAIWGPPCSGKSTLAQNLGKFFSIPVYHSDEIFDSGLIKNSMSKIKNIAASIVLKKKWIIEGNFGELREEVLSRCQLLIILNLPIHILISRLVKRTISAYSRVQLVSTSYFHRIEYPNIIKVIQGEIYLSIKLIVSFKRSYIHYLIYLAELRLKSSNIKILLKSLPIEDFFLSN